MHNVQQRQRLIPSSVYKQELAKCQLGDNIANHMGYIFTAILYDKFDMTFKQVTNFYSKTVERRKSWQDDDDEAVTSESMMAYCRKKKIDVVKWVKSIPMSKKLYMADIKNGRAVLGADRNIESALASTMYLTIPTLKDSYRFSNAKIEEFMNWVAYYIDSYWRKQPKSLGYCNRKSGEIRIINMGEMTKTSVKYCRKCKYSYNHSQTEIMCGYYSKTGLRRGCPIGMCDKFEKKGRKRKVKLK